MSITGRSGASASGTKATPGWPCICAVDSAVTPTARSAAIAARQSGLEVLGISLVTNPAAGISDHPLSHEEVIEAGQAAAGRCGRLLADVVTRIVSG